MVEGAKCALAVPASWNHNLLINAHGACSPDASLAAPVNTEAVSFRSLLREGWIVAATSYRRNGLIIRDTIADIGVLRTYIGQRYGLLRSVIVLGTSMGGTIVTLLAEQASGPYQGLLAVDPALDMRESYLPTELTYRPKIPLLFLCNQNELTASAHRYSLFSPRILSQMTRADAPRLPCLFAWSKAPRLCQIADPVELQPMPSAMDLTVSPTGCRLSIIKLMEDSP